MKLITALIFLSLCSCTLFNKEEESDELVKMGQMVLKSKEGLDIKIEPIIEQKK